MRRFVSLGICFFLSVALPLQSEAQESPELNEKGMDVDFLFSYYDQDGDHSAVTGGIGTETMRVLSPVVLITCRISEFWTLSADLGTDFISSASIGNIGEVGGQNQLRSMTLGKDDHDDDDDDEDNVSGASIPAGERRSFGVFKATRQIGDQMIGFAVGASNDFDYSSISAGLDWSIDLAQKNSSIAASIRHYADTIDLIDIYGSNQGQDDRNTTDVSLTYSQVLGRRTTASIELFYSAQDGFLSTPFHQVILAPSDEFPEGLRVAERLPDQRNRASLGLRLNHAFSDSVVQRALFRYYDDDWGITAQSVELETHFRLPTQREMWLFPFVRFHTQTGVDYFAEAGTLVGDEQYFTSDWDLAELDSDKIGVGLKVIAPPENGMWLNANRFETRVSYYSRDEGLSAITVSFAYGWTF